MYLFYLIYKLLLIYDLINSLSVFSSIFPDLLSINFPFLNIAKVGNPPISYFSIRSAPLSSLTFKNFTSVISFDNFINYNKIYFLN